MTTTTSHIPAEVREHIATLDGADHQEYVLVLASAQPGLLAAWREAAHDIAIHVMEGEKVEDLTSEIEHYRELTQRRADDATALWKDGIRWDDESGLSLAEWVKEVL